MGPIHCGVNPTSHDAQSSTLLVVAGIWMWMILYLRPNKPCSSIAKKRKPPWAESPFKRTCICKKMLQIKLSKRMIMSSWVATIMGASQIEGPKCKLIDYGVSSCLIHIILYVNFGETRFQSKLRWFMWIASNWIKSKVVKTFIQQHALMKLVCGKLFLSTIDMMIVNILDGFLMIRVSIGSEVLEWSDKLWCQMVAFHCVNCWEVHSKQQLDYLLL